jgi:hypothetical protein
MHLAQTWKRISLVQNSQPHLVPPPLSLRLLPLAVFPTVVVAKSPVAAAAGVAFPTNVMRVAALTTSCRLAQLRMTHC